MVEHPAVNRRVGGSSPSCGANSPCAGPARNPPVPRGLPRRTGLSTPACGVPGPSQGCTGAGAQSGPGEVPSAVEHNLTRMRPRLPATVVALGVVSLLTDLSSEMIYPLLPLFLATVLGAGPQALGLVEGVAESTAALFKIASGAWSDRARRRKPLIVAGWLSRYRSARSSAAAVSCSVTML